jgi:hypothetical protein
MNRRNFIQLAALGSLSVRLKSRLAFGQSDPAKRIRVGIIGLDTSHSIHFTKILNNPHAAPDLAGCPVVAAFPKGSLDIESSVSRIPKYTEKIQKMGVEIVDSEDALLEKVDAVLLETNDGRRHLEQALKVFKAGKPVFIDKPLAASLTDVLAIFDAAKRYNVPMFSSSSLRYMQHAQALRHGKMGKVLGAETYGPAPIDPTHPDLYWYGVHGVEALFTVMRPGCERLVRVHTEDTDVVVGTWADGRIGTFRGRRSGQWDDGGIGFTENGETPIGPYKGYRPLLVEIVKFFRTGKAPVSPHETIEIYAFMSAADRSRCSGGESVALNNVLARARQGEGLGH